MKIEKVKSKLKKVFNRVMGVLLPVATLFVSCSTNALVVHAAESYYNKGNTVTFTTNYCSTKDKDHISRTTQTGTIQANSDYEIVAVLVDYYSGTEIHHSTLSFKIIKSASEIYGLQKSGVSSCSGEVINYKDGDLLSSQEYSIDKLPSEIYAKGNADGSITVSCSITGCKVFKDSDSLKAYITSGDTSGMIEVKDPELEKGWYLKNLSYKVTADDSPSSEAGEDATYIHFSWDTDNLKDGDLLEIKTYNYYKKILGEKLSGFYDFITYSDGVAASSGKYSFSQYTATKAWFNSLENKPLVFKEYDTTDYYLRPVRMGALGVEKYGGWVHVKMGRSTPTSSPYIEDVEYGDFDDDNNWTVDEDLTDKNGGHHGIDQGGDYISPDQSENPFTGTNLAGMFSYFFDFMKNIPSMLADLPALVSSIIGFLPPVIIGFIGIGVVIAIILRVVGR